MKIDGLFAPNASSICLQQTIYFKQIDGLPYFNVYLPYFHVSKRA